jgi:hypothetical protein
MMQRSNIYCAAHIFWHGSIAAAESRNPVSDERSIRHDEKRRHPPDAGARDYEGR